jgi:O-antigen/teichoic acid export membrane protein
LATFAVGVFAVRELSVEQLGAYALLFSALQVAIQIATELVLIPSQVVAVDHPFDVRLGMLRHSLPKGTLLALLSAVLVPLGVIPLTSVLPIEELAPLALSAAGLAWLSPIQDHLRSMFHLSSRSWVAAGMSATHLVVTAAAMAALSGLLPLWTPFGALILGNASSLVLAGILVRRIGPGSCPKPSRREIASVGGWLLATGISKTGAGYLTRALLNTFVGTAALGFVEAARVVAQPINVLALGLMAQVGPRLTEASAKKSAPAVKKWRRRFVILLGIVALPYTILAAFPWPINPLSSLTPRAYEVPGLTAAMLVAVTVACLLRPLRAELLGARLQRAITQVTVSTSVIEIVVIVAGNLLGAYVVPLGVLLSALAGIALLTRRMRSIFSRDADPSVQSLSPI